MIKIEIVDIEPRQLCVRDVPYQAQAQLTIYPLLKSLAENKIKGNHGFCTCIICVHICIRLFSFADISAPYELR